MIIKHKYSKQHYCYALIISLSIFTISCSKKFERIEVSELSSPISTRINKTFWQDSQNGFLCGGEKNSSGYIYHTLDGGNSWQKIYSNTNKSLYDIFFVDANVGYCCGEKLLLLITNDGGLTWNEFNYPIDAPNYLNLTLRNITGNQEFVLFVGGDNFNAGVSLKFINGGFPWQFYRYDSEMRTSIAFNVHNYIACGYGLTYRTIDTGFNFTPLHATEDFFTGSSVVNNTAFACGYNGGIYKITNSENSWTKIIDANKIFKKTRIHFNGIYMSSQTNGFAIGNDGLIIKTIDGKNWKRCTEIGSTNLLSIANNKSGKLIISSADGKLYVIEI